jgi:hypothetical protein
MDRAHRALRALAVGIACAGAAVSGRANAQQPGSASAKVTAEALFVEGRRLVAAGQYAEACPKFADSERLDPSPATLLNLASCYERVGRSATAWATYREAASVANAAGRHELVGAAERHADSLVPHLSRLTITVAQPVEGIEVKRDGLVVDRAEWGTPIPLDPGPHTIGATAPGYRAWNSTIEVGRDAAPAGATVPALEPAPHDEAVAPEAVSQSSPATSATTPTATVVVSPAALAPSNADRDPGRGQRLVGWTIGAAGVASLAIGGGFAIAAEVRYKQSLDHCHISNNICDSTGVSMREEARSRGDVATWTVIGGAAAAAVGLTVVLTAPHGTREERPQGASLTMRPTLGGAVLEGTW